MASRANLDIDIADGSSGFVDGSTGRTADFGRFIVWMNFGFHKFLCRCVYWVFMLAKKASLVLESLIFSSNNSMLSVILMGESTFLRTNTF